MTETAVVLLSGGLDSSTCAAMATRDMKGPDNVDALTLSYGQKHNREIEAAKAVARELGLRSLLTMDLGDMLLGDECSLTNPSLEVPEGSYAEGAGVSTYVPFRNGVFLSIAASYALKLGASYVYYGAHNEDATSGAYPDTTFEFNGAIANSIYTGTGQKVRLVTPLQWASKSDIVRLASIIGVPIELTYSCYKGGEKHCGKCPTCLGRIEAFRHWGEKDPVSYEYDPFKSLNSAEKY